MNKIVFTIGDGINKEFILSHNLGTENFLISVRENKIPGFIVHPDISVVDENRIKVSCTIDPSKEGYVVTVIG